VRQGAQGLIELVDVKEEKLNILLGFMAPYILNPCVGFIIYLRKKTVENAYYKKLLREIDGASKGDEDPLT